MKQTEQPIPIKQVKTKSGILGWQARIQDVYASYEEFAQYAGIYNLPRRLGYKGARAVWLANPLIQGSVNPEDYCVVNEVKSTTPTLKM